MNKTLKILGIVLGVVVLAIVALAVALVLLVDPNDYKDEITQAVKENTGRELKIEGDLGLSVFPWLGLEIGAAELANARGFGKEPFARINSAGVRVKLLPLLRKALVIDTVHMDGLKLHLARNRAGKTNWDDLIAAEAKKPPTPAPAKETPAADIGIAALTVRGIAIRDGEIGWRDDMTRTQYTLRDLELKSGNIAPGKPVDVRLGFAVEGTDLPQAIRVGLETRASLDLEQQTLDVAKLDLKADELALRGNFRARKLRDNPQVDGQLELPTLDARALMKRFAVTMETADKTVLAKLSLKTDFSASTRAITLKKLDARLDDSQLTGTLGVRMASTPAYSFDLKVDQIDLDRYLPPASTGQAAGKQAGSAGTPASAAPLPLDTLRELVLEGQAAIGKLKAFGLRSSDVLVKLSAKNGRLTIGPNKATLYGGRYDGRTIVDARPKVPLYYISEKLTGIDLGPFLKDAEIYDKLSGKGNLTLDLQARGVDQASVLNTLSGKGALAVGNGKIEGVNLQKSVNDARAQYAKLRGKPVPVLPNASDATVFSSLTGTMTLANGVASNNDLKMDGDNLRATGKGTVNLPKQTIDYRLYVTLAEAATRKGTTVPVDVKGALEQPTYSVAWNEVLKEQVEKKIEQKKQEKEEEVKDKLREKLKRKFKF